MSISVGDQSPDFSLMDDSSVIRKLSDYRGHPVILYFYPKDDTPGCTTEACNFRDDYAFYKAADIVILGISPDSPRSHSKFRSKYSLPFPLLADLGHVVCDSYGVWGRKKAMGREYEGVKRTTFVIDLDGNIAGIFENVRPADHSAQILEAMKTLKII
jgi:thioredoxin-dependent peroxiredoxin